MLWGSGSFGLGEEVAGDGSDGVIHYVCE